MKFAEAHNNQTFFITGYDQQSIRINGKSFDKGLILTSNSFYSNWSAQTYARLKVSHLNEIFTLKPELILLGTGRKQLFPNKDIYLALINSNIGFEIMNTQAACRTFNILTADGRNVAAALFTH